MPDFDTDARSLARHLTWLVTRSRTMSDTKLAGRPSGCSTTRADLIRSLLQQLADTEAGLARRGEPVEPTWPNVPRLRDLAVGDQLAVLGHDLLSALGAVAVEPGPLAAQVALGPAPEWSVWTRGGRRPLTDVVTDLAGHAGRLREQL